MHSVAATHEIADSSPSYLVAGIFMFLQLDPFQMAPMGYDPPLANADVVPTAMQNELETHDTPDRPLSGTDPADVG